MTLTKKKKKKYQYDEKDFHTIQLLKIIYPRAIINLKYNNDVVQDKLIASIISFIYHITA